MLLVGEGALVQKDYLKGIENTMGRTVRKATERSGVWREFRGKVKSFT